MGVQRHQIARQSGRIGEVENPCTTGRQPDQKPRCPFRQPQAQLAQVPFFLAVQAEACISVALDPALDEDEKIGPDRLRAGITAPDAAQRRSEQEQAQPGHDQKARDEIEFMRPDLDPEKEEAAVGQIDQNGLIRQVRTTVPPQPRRDVVDAQCDRHDHPFEVTEVTRNAARKDRLTRGVKAWRDVWFSLGHGGIAPSHAGMMAPFHSLAATQP